MPPLEKLLAKQKQRTRQTWQEQMHIMSIWTAVQRKIVAQEKAMGT